MTYNIRGNRRCYHYCMGLPNQSPSFSPWPIGLLGSSCLLKVIIDFLKARLLSSLVSPQTSPSFPSLKHSAHVAPVLPWPPRCSPPPCPHQGARLPPLSLSHSFPCAFSAAFSLLSPTGLLSDVTHIHSLHLHLQGDDSTRPAHLASSGLEGLTSVVSSHPVFH